MSAASGTRIFGLKISVDPKILVGGLFAVAVVLFFLHSRGDEGASGSTPAASAGTAAPPSFAAAAQSRPARKRNRSSLALMERGTLRIRPVDATRGDIDPTLRMDMLQRLQSVPEPAVGRSLFDVGEVMPTNAEITKLNTKIVPAALPTPAGPAGPAAPVVPQVNIPLKFYGFEKPARQASVSQGLFLDGDNIIVAAEGDLVDGRYRVVSLTSQDARLEDTQLKQGQTLPVMPEATQQ